MRQWILVMVVLFTPWLVQAELPLGEVPALIELSGDKGGRINGESWSSSELQGKVFVLFYADPDEADLNNDASEAIKAEDFDKQKYGSVAVTTIGPCSGVKPWCRSAFTESPAVYPAVP